jgi:hypothetical protein
MDRADKSIRVDLCVQNGILAMQCLEHTNGNLKYNICGIGDTSLLNSEVDGLSERISERISEALRYSCCYFATHLVMLTLSFGSYPNSCSSILGPLRITMCTMCRTSHHRSAKSMNNAKPILWPVFKDEASAETVDDSSSII